MSTDKHEKSIYYVKRVNLIERMEQELNEICERGVAVAEQYRGSQGLDAQHCTRLLDSFRLDMDAIATEAGEIVQRYITEVRTWE